MNLSQRMRKIGWLFFAIMWIPFTVLMISMIGMPSGSYDWGELPLLARISMIGIGIFGIGCTLLLVGAPIMSGLKNKSLIQNGQPAEARILKVMDTGTTINNNPVVRLQLEVHTPGGEVFQAEAERLIPRLQVPQIQPGVTVQVKYDPASHAVALVSE